MHFSVFVRSRFMCQIRIAARQREPCTSMALLSLPLAVFDKIVQFFHSVGTSSSIEQNNHYCVLIRVYSPLTKIR